MSRTDSQEPANDDVEKLFQEVFPIIPTIVGQACASLRHYPDQAEVDSFAQQIGFLLWRNDYRVLRSFKHESSPKTWLFTVATRSIWRWLRERDAGERLDDMPPDSFTVKPYQEESLLSKERDEIVQAAESKLTERERKLFDLWRDGLSNEEIAEKMNIKKKTVSTKKSALAKKIRRLIREK